MDTPTLLMCITALIFICAFAGLCICSSEIGQDDKREQDRRLMVLDMELRRQACEDLPPYHEGLEDHSRADTAERSKEDHDFLRKLPRMQRLEMERQAAWRFETAPGMPTRTRYGIVGSGATPHIGNRDRERYVPPGLDRRRRSTGSYDETRRTSDDYTPPQMAIVITDPSPSYSAPSTDHSSTCHSPSFDSSPSTDCGGGSSDCGGGGCDF